MVTITMLGTFIAFIYSIVQICNFYGIEQSTYGIYVLFYLFIAFSSLILPTNSA
jgi:hypothetical protein